MKFVKKLIAITLCFSINCRISQISFGLEKYNEGMCFAERINSFESLEDDVQSGKTDFIKDLRTICGREYTIIISVLKDESLKKIIELLTPNIMISDFEKIYETEKSETKRQNIKINKISLLVALITGILTYAISFFKINAEKTKQEQCNADIRQNKESVLKASKLKSFLYSLFKGICVSLPLYFLLFVFLNTYLTKPSIDYERLICEYNNKLSVVKILLKNIAFTKFTDKNMLCLRLVDFDKPDFFINICGFKHGEINYTTMEVSKIKNAINLFTNQLQNIIDTYEEIK